MGAEDGFVIRVQGSGGHASRPQDCKDAIVCACSIVGELQTVVSRDIDPASLAVLSVTSIKGDNIKNAIASEACIEGDCRHFDATTSEAIETSMRRIAKGVGLAHGCEVDVNYERIFVPLVNDEDVTDFAVDAAKSVFGEERTNAAAPRMGASEDFAQALTFAPGAFGFFGNGDSAPLHSDKYDFNDDALVPAVNWFLEVVKKRLTNIS